ncbi:hypothetical protein BH760_gp73 [Gordonia phage Splinter]|uniref:Uncharacterized protein n=2 Tax=Vendettavirus vendetta TaxID=2049886 RepID=A0A160DD34_9CAUD|nr:hypothetical protein BH795_gp73 [Gordonia phage Vendetta]YP_009275392.1 hypothetical protein BH760_gp73 [Gordonia phage Splinter]ANA85585.1 hypothetical protein PBI_VENDETTA_38 [Gordonia phage Vendetta]ANA85664.1 hypothetical protein PBI_SPLINTER_38 [Gordonia phage Splinter]
MTFVLTCTMIVSAIALVARIPAWTRSPWTRPLTISVAAILAMLVLRGTPANDWYNSAVNATASGWPANLPSVASNVARLALTFAIVAHALISLQLARYLRFVIPGFVVSALAMLAAYSASDFTSTTGLDIGNPWEPMTYHWLILAGTEAIAVALLMWAVFVSLDGAKPGERAVLLMWFTSASFFAVGLILRTVNVLEAGVTQFSGGLWPITLTATLLFSAGVLTLAGQACHRNRRRSKGAPRGMGRETSIR